MAQQLPALLGVGVGSFATYAVTSMAERARWQRERNARWDEARMQAYDNYAAAIKRLYRLAIRIAAARGFPHSTDPLAPDDTALEALASAEDERAHAWEGVLLLGTPETVAAARAWHQMNWRLVWFAQGRLTSATDWKPALEESERTRDAFYQSARRDLGVAGAVIRTPPWPPQWMRDLTPDGDVADG